MERLRCAALEDNDWRKIQALQDFQQALSALTFFADVPEKTTRIQRRRFRCYHDAAVVAYCRPFTNSNGLPKLSLKALGIRPTVAEKEIHRRALEYRNKVAAHTDTDRMRLLLTSFDAFGDGEMAMPHIVEDEGFEFLDAMDEFEAWLHKLVDALARFVFNLAQGLPLGTRLLRDYRENGG